MFDSKNYFKIENNAIMKQYETSLKQITSILHESKELALSDSSDKKEHYFYFAKIASLILKLCNLEKQLDDTFFKQKDFSNLLKLNEDLYSEILPQNYPQSYADPTYCVKVFGEEFGQLFSYFYTQIRKMITYTYTHQVFRLYEMNQIFIEFYRYVRSQNIEYESIKKIIVSPLFNKKSKNNYYFYKLRYDINYKHYIDILELNDFNDLRYLFRAGQYISENEIKIAKFMNTYSDERIKALSKSIVNSYLRSFKENNKDIYSKKTVGLNYKIGLERLCREIIKEFRKIDLECTVIGVSTTNPNTQYIFDHKFDYALYLNEDYIKIEPKRLKENLEKNKVLLKYYSGSINFIKFGDNAFTPQVKKETPKLNEIQKKIYSNLNNDIIRIRHNYLHPSETSFSMIAFPTPEIGDNFERIFDTFVGIYLLDSLEYERIQQSIIDVLDHADYVHLRGKNGNSTNLKIKMNQIENPEKETNFVNSGATSNIPAGEVFTTPRLKGTNGILHIEESYLGLYRFENLKLEFKDGYVTNYSCSNFAFEEENKKYIEDHLLFPYKTLPMGEFAIGTNTAAFIAAKKFNIMNVLTMLILEKTSPHIALGDTCFSRREDIKIYNQFNKKEIVAKGNEKSLLSNSNISDAYTNVHRDITIPFDSLDYIRVIEKNKNTIDIIKGGRFVLEGTEELNKHLKEF